MENSQKCRIIIIQEATGNVKCLWNKGGTHMNTVYLIVGFAVALYSLYRFDAWLTN